MLGYFLEFRTVDLRLQEVGRGGEGGGFRLGMELTHSRTAASTAPGTYESHYKSVLSAYHRKTFFFSDLSERVDTNDMYHGPHFPTYNSHCPPCQSYLNKICWGGG